MQRPLVATLLLATCVRLLGAQELRGTIRDSASSQPLPGVVLVLLDSAGRTLGRNITNERGQYRLALDPAIRRMRALRIGFRPRELTLPAGPAGGTPFDFKMAAIPTLLEPVRVVENPSCPRRSDQAAAFALWEQAKTALLATIVAREANPAQVVRYTFDRTMDGGGTQIVKQSISVDSVTTSQPFAASGTAAEFAEHGFEKDSSGLGIYFGPDADVLLDDAFSSAYCFRLADAERTRSNQVGIAFNAARSRRGRVDIEGAAWIDTSSRALVDVMWRYAGLAYQTARYEPGGHVWFRTMPNGSVLIDRWFIRLPHAVTLPPRARYPVPPQIREQGGELARARWVDGQEWRATLGSVTAVATRNGEPAVGRHVQLLDSPYEALTDSTGRFTIADLLPGPYRVGFADSRLAAVGLILNAGTQFSVARDTAANIALEAPTIDDFVATLCGNSTPAADQSLVLVRVRRRDGEPVDGATVVIRADAGDGAVRELARGKTDRRGLVHLCRAPREAVISVSAEARGYRIAAGSTQTTDILTAVDLRVEPNHDGNP